MNRRARRATRAAHRPAAARRSRRALSPATRIGLIVAGTILAVGAIVLAVHGQGSRAARFIGVAVVVGIALVAVAWNGTA